MTHSIRKDQQAPQFQDLGRSPEDLDVSGDQERHLQ
jgi:hypothetical protein